MTSKEFETVMARVGRVPKAMCCDAGWNSAHDLTSEEFDTVVARVARVPNFAISADTRHIFFKTCRDIKTKFETFLGRLKKAHSKAEAFVTHKMFTLPPNVVKACYELDDAEFDRIVDSEYLKRILKLPAPRQTWDGYACALRVLSQQEFKLLVDKIHISKLKLFSETLNFLKK